MKSKLLLKQQNSKMVGNNDDETNVRVSIPLKRQHVCLKINFEATWKDEKSTTFDYVIYKSHGRIIKAWTTTLGLDV